MFNNHNLTLIVMENGTTAMTGRRDHPGAGRNANGPSEAIPVQGFSEGLEVKASGRWTPTARYDSSNW